MIKIDFSIAKDGMAFVDTIVLPDDHGFTSEEIEAMKQARFDAWHQIVTAPSTEEPIEGEVN